MIYGIIKENTKSLDALYKNMVKIDFSRQVYLLRTV